MPRLYRSEEPHSDLSADGPNHLDREPVTGQKFNRYMFSNCDPEGARCEGRPASNPRSRRFD
jgi:hypothetical protein